MGQPVRASIDRRSFLLGLLSVGAALKLPVSVSAATPAEIDDAWEDLLKDPFVFKVGDRTIVDPDVDEPQVWRDMFDDISRHRLVDDIECCPPLLSYIEAVAADYMPPYLKSIRRHAAKVPGEDGKKLQRLAAQLEDPNWGWKAWLELGGAPAQAEVWALVQQWLDEPVDWSQSEWFPHDSNGQGAAYRYFQSLPFDVCDELGVVIVEGDMPGSTYFAAELHHSVTDANRAAARLGLPFRFA